MKAIFLMLPFIASVINAKAQTTSTITVRSQSEASKAHTVVEGIPEFPGGVSEQMKYISTQINYPQSAKDSAYTGTCYIKFTIDTAGYIKDAKILKGVPHCPECDQEALRAIQAMPRWKPAKQNGKAVNVYYNLPIHFKLK
jgi:protein TonB